MLKKSFLGILFISLLAFFVGCAFNSGETGKENHDYSKEIIQEELNLSEGVSEITWSPDGQMVIYNDGDKVCFRKMREEKAQVVREDSGENCSFTWSPDSRYFLITEKRENKLVSTIVEAATLAEEKYQIKSTSLPLWSPDGLSLVFADETNDYGENWGSMKIYELGEQESAYIWKAKNTLYRPELWDGDGNISYIEIYEGKETGKTTKNIKPNISGVHLGDTGDQVRGVLGNDYKETSLGEVMGHFPEQVYRWTYDEGYTVFIGKESGTVLEIIATSPEVETNLGVKVGDTAEKVFQAYRPHYIEPESIHGGKLYGVFKVEGAAALCFDFMLEEGETQFDQDIRGDAQVECIKLTYPEHLDDSF